MWRHCSLCSLSLTKFAQFPPKCFPLGFSHKTQAGVGPVWIFQRCSLHVADTQGFILGQKIAKSDISWLGKFSFTHVGSSGFNVNREQVLKLGAQNSTMPIPVLQKPAQSYPHLLTDMKKKFLIRASCNKAACRGGGKKVEYYNWLFRAKEKEENYHRWWWQMRQPRKLGKMWIIFDYWYGYFCGEAPTSSKPIQQQGATYYNIKLELQNFLPSFFKYPNHCNQY